MTATMRALRDDATALLADVATAMGDVQETLAGGTYTASTVRHLRAEVWGLLGDARAWRRSLDAVDVEAQQATSDALVTLQALRWERELRHEVQRTCYVLRRLWAALEQLEVGQARTAHLVQRGDTLQRLAARYLGSWSEWPRLLDANPDLVPGSALVPGTILTVPAKS